MSFPSYQRLSDTEIQAVVEALQEADDNHAEWLSHLHTSLVCKQPFNADALSGQAHTLCKFGRWYYRDAPDLLRQHPGFIAIEELHREMHDCARHVATRAQSGEVISPEEYSRFVNRQRELSRCLVALRDELRELHFAFDTLTGVVNRHAFFRMLAQEYERARRTGEKCVLAMADIDHFKSINDSYGHLAGDSVLVNVACRLTEGVRKYDCVSRFGGEEFLMYLPQVTVPQSVEILDRVREEIARTPVTFEDGSVTISVSFGVAALDIDLPPDISIERADKALYQAKESGRNRIVCYPL